MIMVSSEYYLVYYLHFPELLRIVNIMSAHIISAVRLDGFCD